MSERFEIRLAGTGGQGLILAGIILGEAAAIFENKYAVQTQSYGPESRGGASRAEVVISDQEIDYPKVTVPDVFLAMSQMSMDKYGQIIKPEGLEILDTTFVTPPSQGLCKKIAALPITQITKEKLGKLIVANIVALGVLVGMTGVVKENSLCKALQNRVPQGTEEINLKAFQLGLELIKEIK